MKTLAALGVRVIGANCGRGTDEMLGIAREMAEAREAGTFLITQSNAGLPQLIDGDFKYTGTPEEMGEFARTMRDIGINIVGSCCGSTTLAEQLVQHRANGVVFTVSRSDDQDVDGRDVHAAEGRPARE